ncbi:MAG TPA: TetR/AcrR family transcriptional regulator [Mycobacteriales bacterium]|jgi:AcrR family transcriptional regulator
MARRSVEVERRRQILEATCAAVADGGLRNLRIADVARRAGLSNGSVHYYFDSKQALLRAAFEFNFRASLERRRWIAETDTDPVSRLRLVVESYLPQSEDTVEAWLVWVELWVSALREPTLRTLNDEVYGEWRGFVADVVRQGQDQGLLRPGDPYRFTDELIGMLDGLAIQVLIGSGHMTVGRMRDTCMALIDAVADTRVVPHA